jgi:hypothetical protein
LLLRTRPLFGKRANEARVKIEEMIGVKEADIKNTEKAQKACL